MNKYTIKKKLEYIFTEHQIKNKINNLMNNIKLKYLLFGVVVSSIGLTIPYLNGSSYSKYYNPEYTVKTLKEFLELSFFASSQLFLLFISILIILNYFYKKEFLFTMIYRNNKILSELRKEFGTVNNLISIYNQLNKSNIDLTDENFNLMNKEPEEDAKRREILTNERREKLNKKISKIEKEKEELTLSDKRKIKKVLRNRDPEIEYKKEKIEGILFSDMIKVSMKG